MGIVRTWGCQSAHTAMLSQKTTRLLIEKVRFNLSLEKSILNTRRLANFILDKSRNLEFALEPVDIFETQTAKEKVLTKAHRELKMNKPFSGIEGNARDKRTLNESRHSQTTAVVLEAVIARIPPLRS